MKVIDGVIRVGSSRVTLDTVLEAFNDGETPERITEAYPAISLAEVYAVIAHYLRHTEEVDRYLAARQTQRDQLRKQVQHDPRHQQLRQRLLDRAREKDLR